MHGLKVGYSYVPNDASNLGAQRREITSNVSIVCYLFDPASLPGVPVSDDGENDCRGQKHHQQRCPVLLPIRSLERGNVVRVNRFDGRKCRFRRLCWDGTRWFWG